MYYAWTVNGSEGVYRNRLEKKARGCSVCRVQRYFIAPQIVGSEGTDGVRRSFVGECVSVVKVKVKVVRETCRVGAQQSHPPESLEEVEH